MRDMAAAERFEEAADARDRAAALARALSRHRRLDSLRQAGRLELEVDGDHVVLAGGTLAAGPGMLALVPDGAGPTDGSHDDRPSGGERDAPLPCNLVDEVACVAAWLDAEGRAATLVSCDGAWASPLPVLPGYEPAGRPASRRDR